MSKVGSERRPSLILIMTALLLVAVPGLYVYMKATSGPLHPNPQDVPAVTTSAPPAAWQEPAEQARQIVRTSLAAQNLPGISVAVAARGAVVWAEGFGFADVDNKTPMAPHHRFRIGTASVVLTSAAAGLLIDEGRLKLDEPIQTYLPDFPRKQWPMSVRQVMAHTAGLRNDGGDESPLYGEHCDRPAQAFTHFANESLRFEPGTSYRYSNYGWIVVSAAIEAITGRPLAEFLKTRVFEPVGMRDTMPESAAENIPNRASFYFPRFAADPTWGLHPMRDLDYSCYSGASYFLSTPSDLVRYAVAVQNGALLKPATVQTLQTSQRLASGAETGYGLGWDIETVTVKGRAVRSVGHNGDALGGKVASLLALPDEGIVVSVMSNISYADTFSLAVKIAEIFAGGEPATAARTSTP